MERTIPINPILEKGYNVRLLVDDFDGLIEKWSKWSEDFRNWFKKSSHNLCTKETRLYQKSFGIHNPLSCLGLLQKGKAITISLQTSESILCT